MFNSTKWNFSQCLSSVAPITWQTDRPIAILWCIPWWGLWQLTSIKRKTYHRKLKSSNIQDSFPLDKTGSLTAAKFTETLPAVLDKRSSRVIKRRKLGRLLTSPPVAMAMSCRVNLRLSPKPGAFTAQTCRPTFILQHFQASFAVVLRPRNLPWI